MQVILSGFDGLKQHIKQIKESPYRYRPNRCPNCGKAGLWCHGGYFRKPGRRPDDRYLNPVWIPRFMCPECRQTCSVLPECIPPRRWHLWATQQIVLNGVLHDRSIRSVGHHEGLVRSTVRRWKRWLEDRFVAQAACLRSVFSEFGRYPELQSFWWAVWQAMTLAKAMLFCHQTGMTVP